jgi:hypothetical protein
VDPPRPLARPRPRHVRPVVADWCAEHAARIGDAPAADYLFEELTSAPEGFVTSSATRTFLDKFRRAVDSSAYEADLAGVTDITARRSLVEAWLSSYAASAGEGDADPPESVAVELCPGLVR